ncbi:MAG: IMPACT family protein [Promethearchaeota archaeon]
MLEIKESGRGFPRVIKKSRFICSIGKVHSISEAESFLEKVKGDYPRATHHAFAYRIGDPVTWETSSDDGEPRGTAGIPLIKLLKGRNITNTIIVVTRFYGGIKLGTGGLIKAYSKTAIDLLDKIDVINTQ